jgi:hypothetical protein
MREHIAPTVRRDVAATSSGTSSRAQHASGGADRRQLHPAHELLHRVDTNVQPPRTLLVGLVNRRH